MPLRRVPNRLAPCEIWDTPQGRVPVSIAPKCKNPGAAPQPSGIFFQFSP